MSKSIDIDTAVEHIKNIVDNIRCAVCDKSGGSRMRYACGHTSCEDCVVLAVDCSVCLTPPLSSSREPVIDKSLTQRASNAVNLLNVFQNEFHIDVYKRHRISEQLKVEKELFPECIQAPFKYCNKRKSFNHSKHNKENRLSQLPGEEISPISNYKMESPNKNVERWLNQYVRKPFADLNSNDERLRNNAKELKNKQNTIEQVDTPLKRSTRKRSHSKKALSAGKNQSLTVDHLTPVKKDCPQKKPRMEKVYVKPDTSKKIITGPNKTSIDCGVSGISMDDEEVISIDDSQSIRIDKDMLALQAVIDAERNTQFTTVSDFNPRSIETTPSNEKAIIAEMKSITKVPFYLKSCLSEKCNDCNENKLVQSDNVIGSITNPGSDNTETNKDISITIENKNFVAIITIKQADQNINKTNGIQSVEVQTDKIITKNINEENERNETLQDLQSQDVFQDDRRIDGNVELEMSRKSANKTYNVIIEESESDEDLEPSVSLEVTAEIHRSCEEVDYEILADIDNLEEHKKRPRRGQRGFTPTSTDSSEKENYNPNRMKKAPSSKKKPMKK